MKSGVKLLLVGAIAGSITTVLAILVSGSLYFWPVPTARDLCGKDFCAEYGEKYFYTDVDINIDLLGISSTTTMFGFAEYEPDGDVRLTGFGSFRHFFGRSLGPHAAVAALYVEAFNLLGPHMDGGTEIKYPTFGGEMGIIIEQGVIFLQFERPIEEVPSDRLLRFIAVHIDQAVD